jgi:hypothetical protein
MKSLGLLLIVFAFFSVNLAVGQQIKGKSSKVVFYNYNEFNPRISMIFSSDTLDVFQTNEADSIFYYESDGYFNIKLIVDDKLESAIYENGFYDEIGYDEESIKKIREAFQVKFVDTKIFKYENNYYCIYRILSNNKEVKESAVLVFWSKEFGILMQKDLYVNELLRFEYTDNEIKNIVIRHLCFSIYSDSDFSYLKDWQEK